MSITHVEQSVDGLLIDHPQVADHATLRTGGRPVTYVAPTPDAAPEQLHADLARRFGGSPDVVLVRRIPRGADGSVAAAALAPLPVPDPDTPLATVAHPLRLRPAAPEPAAAPAKPAAPTGNGAPSVATGPPLELLPDDPRTVTEAIQTAPRRAGEHQVIAVTAEGDHESGYAELLESGRAILGGLQRRGVAPGGYVILALADLPSYFRAVWACLLGGIRLVTAALPAGFDGESPELTRLRQGWERLGQPLVLGEPPLAAALRGGETPIEVLSVADLADGEPGTAHEPTPDDVAAIVMSSGSTGAPKLIPITHKAIVVNALSSRQVDLIRPGERSFNWLPFDHVPPLVMNLLRDVVLGCTSIHAAPGYILADPLRWLDILDRLRVNHTWCANFGYRLVAEAVAQHPERRWTLGHVRTLLNAGEQCTPVVVREFLARVAPFGIGEQCFVHMWGMAETATAASGKFFARSGAVRTVDVSGTATEFISMGPPTPDSRLRVLGPDGHPVPQGTIGDLQAAGPRITPGYLDAPEVNAAAFTADGWFDTGDLAFMTDDEIVITGRSKEVIVVNGDKHFCHTIEDAVNGLAGVRTGFVAACGLPDQRTGTERLAIFYVPTEDADTRTADRIRGAVRAALHLAVGPVITLPAEEFPKTSGGKIQRATLVARAKAGEFAGYPDEGDGVPDCVFVPGWSRLPARPRFPRPVRTLVFADTLGLADGLDLDGPALIVRRGTTFATTAEGYVLDPGQPDHWSALRAALDERGFTPGQLLYLWSYRTAPATDPADPETRAALDACGRDLVACVGALGGGTESPRLVTVSRGLRTVGETAGGCFPAAAAAAITATYAQEHPGTGSAHLDLPATAPDPAALDAALTDAAAHGTEVAWRDGAPHVRSLTPAPAPGTAVAPPQGRYLVLGGASGVAAALLDGLLDRCGHEVHVVGRRPADDPTVTAWLDRCPAPVRYHSADICEPGALDAVVAAAERAWGAPLDGVFHLADGYRYRFLAEERPADWDYGRHPKVAGLLHAAAVVRARPGARLVVFSSLLGSFAAAGCASYGAGNAVAEAIVEGLGDQATALAWGLWRGVGINEDNPYEQAVVERGVVSLPPDAARALTRETLALPAGTYHVGVDPNGRQTRGLVAGEDALALLCAAQRTDRAALTPAAEAVFRTVAATLEKLVPGAVTPTSALDELGFSSVQMLQVRGRLEAALGSEVPYDTLLTAPDLGTLAQALADGSSTG